MWKKYWATDYDLALNDVWKETRMTSKWSLRNFLNRTRDTNFNTGQEGPGVLGTILKFASGLSMKRKVNSFKKGFCHRESAYAATSFQLGEGSGFQAIGAGIFFLIEKCKKGSELSWRRNIYRTFLFILWVEKIISFAFETSQLSWYGFANTNSTSQRNKQVINFKDMAEIEPKLPYLTSSCLLIYLSILPHKKLCN